MLIIHQQSAHQTNKSDEERSVSRGQFVGAL